MARRHPSAWLLLGPYASSTAIPLLYATRRLATQLGLRRNRVQLQCADVVPRVRAHGGGVRPLRRRAGACLRHAGVARCARRRSRSRRADAGDRHRVQAVGIAGRAHVRRADAGRRHACARYCSVWCRPGCSCSCSSRSTSNTRAARSCIRRRSPTRALGIVDRTGDDDREQRADASHRRGVGNRGGVAGSQRAANRRSSSGSRARCCSRRFLFEPAAHAYYLAPGIALLVVAEYARRGRAPVAVARRGGAAPRVPVPPQPTPVVGRDGRAHCRARRPPDSCEPCSLSVFKVRRRRSRSMQCDGYAGLPKPNCR